MSARRSTGPEDFRRVTPTPEELADWTARHPNRPTPSVYRVECKTCAARIWGSGIAIGSHRKVCS